MESFLRSKLSERGIEPAGVIHEDQSISDSWMKGKSLEMNKSQGDILCFIEKLEAAQSQFMSQ
jgi:hypothetical protein